MAFTYFFRDRSALCAIRDYVLPELRKSRFINVWDAGCATGQEPYSLAIVFKEAMNCYEFKRVRIYATDLDEESNQFGRILAEGVYPEESVKRIPKDILKKYFSCTPRPGYFKVADEIKDRVIFQKHDLRSRCPVRDNFGLIVCKNVLLHLKESERIDIIRMFHRCLTQGGYFVMEQTQKMPDRTAYLFEQIPCNVQLFRKR